MEKKNCANCGMDNDQTAKYCSSCGFQLPKTESKIIENVESQKTSGNKKKILPTIAGIIAFGLSYFAVQHFFFKMPTIDKALIEVANEINQNCPIMIDQDTRLDNTLTMPNNVFIYNYTLVNLEKQNIDTIGLKNFIEPNAINNIRTSPDMERFRENSVTMIYNYKDKNGVFVLKIDVSPEKYK